MKRIYLSLAGAAILAGMSATKVQAQNIDLQAFVLMDPTVQDPLVDTVDRRNDNVALLNYGKNFTRNSASTSTDSVYGVWGIWTNGPDPILTGDEIWFMNSYNKYLTQAQFDASQANGSIPATATFSDKYFSVSGLTYNQDVEENSLAWNQSDKLVDTMGMLVDWTYATANPDSALRFIGPPHETFSTGVDYGFFMRIYGMDDVNNPANTDIFPRNNFYMQKIRFQAGSGIGAVAREVETLNAFPNPAVSNVNVVYNFKQNTFASIIVRDITGKTVKIENLGIQTTGERTFTLDVASLAVGTYTLELSTGESRAISKLVIAK